MKIFENIFKISKSKCLNSTDVILNDDVNERQVLNINFGCLDCFTEYSKQDIISIVNINNFVSLTNGDEKKLSDFLDN